MKRKIIIGVILIFTGLLIWQWSLITYGVDQARGQLEVIFNSRPIDELLNDPEFPDSLKQKLHLAREVRTFAMDELGLSQSDNYTTVYDQKGQTILWNVSASEPYKLEAYKWSFPFLGSMPYKGYFDLEKAKEERARLAAQGYDTRIRTVSGWSTLGILKDPILSNMLERSEGALAEVIIHELTHATIFVKNEIDFNENLASFIGERGAELFLQEKYGDSSQVLLAYLHQLEDQKKLTQHILKGARYLDEVYEEIIEETKEITKHLAIDEIVSALDTVSFHNEKYHRLFDRVDPNNAYFMAFMRYHSQEDTLTSIYTRYERNLPVMIKNLKTLYGK